MQARKRNVIQMSTMMLMIDNLEYYILNLTINTTRETKSNSIEVSKNTFRERKTTSYVLSASKSY